MRKILKKHAEARQLKGCALVRHNTRALANQIVCYIIE